VPDASDVSLLLEVVDDAVVGLVNTVGEEQVVDVALRDCSVVDQKLPIYGVLPVVLSKENDGELQ